MLSQQAVKHIGNSRGKIMGKIIIIIINKNNNIYSAIQLLFHSALQ